MEIKEEKLKEILKEQREEYQNHFDVLREDFDSKVQLITEQYDSIIEKLDSHDARLMTVGKNIEIIKVDIQFIKNSIKQKVDIEEFDLLEKRVVLLEAKINKK